MGGKLYLGEFEHTVLAAVMRLCDAAYGASIIREIREGTGRHVPSGSLSITLDRLEKKGYIRSRMGDPDPNRGGRAKRFVTVTDDGLRAVSEARAAMLHLWSGLETKLDQS